MKFVNYYNVMVSFCLIQFFFFARNRLTISLLLVFDYYVCQRIIEILKNTDKSSKNIFGQYTSKRFQDWQEICKIYEKDNVYLAEDAQTLIRNVNYEVPSLKKCQSKYEQQISDIERSIETSQKQSKNFLNEYNANCKKLAINGDNIRDELYSQLEILPEKMSILAEKIPSLISVCNYYKAFVHFVSQQRYDDRKVMLSTINNRLYYYL